jgi:hypothetical protein
MNEQDRNLVGIVGMDHIDARCEPRIIWPKKRSGGASCYFCGVRIQHRQSRRVIGGDGMWTGRRSHDDRIERIIQFEQRRFSPAFFFDCSYSERNAAGRIVHFLRCSFRILREDHQRCTFSLYFEFVAETSLANRVCQEHSIVRGYVFERFRAQRRRPVYLHPLPVPDRIRLIKCQVKHRFRRIRNLYCMDAARNESAKENVSKTTAPRTPPQSSRGTACRCAEHPPLHGVSLGKSSALTARYFSEVCMIVPFKMFN